MKLENKFFKSFFYPFLSGIVLSTIIVTVFLGVFTTNYYDKRTKQNIINIGKNKSKSIIKAVNALILSFFSRFQVSLNEVIKFYQRIANELLINENSYQYQSDYLKCSLNVDYTICGNFMKAFYMASWLLDEFTTEDNLNDLKVQLQLKAYSNIIPNILTVLDADYPDTDRYFFYFEDTELIIFYPLVNECEYYFYTSTMAHYYQYLFDYNQCLTENGFYQTIYRIKCEAFFQHIKEAQTNTFDNNYSSKRNKTIFINNFYRNMTTFSRHELNMCIEFIDPITKGKAFACVDSFYLYLINSLNNINANLIGYFFVSNVGFKNVFYYPESETSPKIPTDYIFSRDINHKLYEKIDFNNVRKIFSSNYIDNMGSSIYSEAYVNGKNSSGQYFFVDEKKIKYSIYPVIFENLYGEKEHVFSIIYIYDEKIFFEKLDRYFSSVSIKIILELILFIVFGSCLLYLIYLTLNFLCKYIVIPIKNVNYMLKGINVGGSNRLKYLNLLEQKHDDNLEKLEAIFLYERKKNTKGDKNDDTKNNLGTDLQEDESQIDKDDIKDLNYYDNINLSDGFNKIYDEESDYIEKETDFYDFDDQLLQYRPPETERLVNSLMDLKSALLMTSEDRQIEEIIKYSYSEEIFKNYKNIEGAIICQSNIGNLQSQLLEYDKAIYHLVLSLQDNKLKRFLSRNLNDELDESDFLLNKISYSFKKIKNKNNILEDKQLNSLKDNFSQKIIEILINTRYTRLIYAYYNFFKNLQKLNKSNNNIINGQFMNTTFHTINYYHKIIIQYIFLCYFKNDLVKIGESILDFIEFLIKFKFKTSSNDQTFLNFYDRDNPEYKEKQEFKKKIFGKIIKWFNLFEDYIAHVKDNSTLSDLKGVIDNFSKQKLNSDNTEFTLESQSTLNFKLNIQRYDFLKGKFSLSCKNYNDALYFFIRAAQVNSIVIDGLIKKRSLKHIYKITQMLQKNYENFKLKHLFLEKELKTLKNKNNNINNNNKFQRSKNYKRTGKGNVKLIFKEEIEKIKKDIMKDISECNEKQHKDILVLIDFNFYNNQENNLYTHTYIIDFYIDQIMMILKEYISKNDRIGILIYINEYQVICPLMRADKIDINNFSKDLISYKNKVFNCNDEIEEYHITSNEFKDNDSEFNLEGNNNSEDSNEESSEIKDKEEEENFNKIIELVKAINFINKYFTMKRYIKNEKYIILFTDMINIKFVEEEQIKKIMGNLRGDKDSILLLIGKIKQMNLKNEKNELEKIILSKFGEKSEVIYFENINKLKTILSNKNVIKDEIIYPNEIYK